jgi:hypothetical protein
MLVSLGCETLVLVAHALLHVSKLMATITALSQKCFDYFFGARQIRCALHLGSDKLPAALKIPSRLQGQCLGLCYLLSDSASGEASAGAPSDAEALRLAFSAFFFFFSSSR